MQQHSVVVTACSARHTTPTWAQAALLCSAAQSPMKGKALRSANPNSHPRQAAHPGLLLGPVLGIASRLRRAVRRALDGTSGAAGGAAGGVGGGVRCVGGSVGGLAGQVLGLLQESGECAVTEG